MTDQPRRPECAEPAVAVMAAHEQRHRTRHYKQVADDAEQLLQLFPDGDPTDVLEDVHLGGSRR